MKKAIFLLSLTALFAAGCAGKGGSSAAPTAPSVPSMPSATSAQPSTPSTDTGTIPPGPDDFEGYVKLTTAPENNKIYKYGNYQGNVGKMIFMNGDIHRDERGEYPWYATSSEHPTEGVDIKVAYTDETHFTMQVVGGGIVDTNHGKYLSVHETVNASTGKLTVSFSFVDEAKVWEFNSTLGAPDRDLSGEKSAELTVERATLGTYDEYQTFSAVSDFRYDQNFIAHLWEALPIPE